MKRALISDLHAAAEERGPGYLEACLKAGKISRDGQWMIFDDAAHHKLRRQFSNGRAEVPLRLKFGRRSSTALPPRGLGLGDALHSVAGPIGRKIHWPCLKGDGSTDLKPGSPCAKMRQAANTIQIPTPPSLLAWAGARAKKLAQTFRYLVNRGK
jgi:hypothetical protein